MYMQNGIRNLAVKINQCGKKIQGLKRRGSIMPYCRDGREVFDYYSIARMGDRFLYSLSVSAEWQMNYVFEMLPPEQ